MLATVNRDGHGPQQIEMLQLELTPTHGRHPACETDHSQVQSAGFLSSLYSRATILWLQIKPEYEWDPF